MTLLIASATPNVIYQASDYRLTSKGQVVSDSSAKLVILQFAEWRGLLTYTGIGSVGKQSTAEFVVNWLKDKPDLTIEQMLEILRDKGSPWIRLTSAKQPHTFLFTGFENGRPAVATVSNFEDLLGNYRNVADPKLSICMRRGSAVPKVVICGAKPAVSQADFRLLKETVRRRGDYPNEIRTLLRDINARAAISPNSNGLISEECSTVSLRADGQGQYQPDGNVEMHHISLGIYVDLRKLAKSIKFEGELKAATFGFISDNQPFPKCKPVVEANDSPQAAYELIEIGHNDIASAIALSTADTGLLVGNGNPKGNPAYNMLLIKRDDLELQHWDEGQARAGSVNDDQLIAATMFRNDRNWSAAVINYKANEVRILPEFIEGGDSEANYINSDGSVVGRVTIDLERREQAFWRPAAWIENQLYVLNSDEFDWGYGVAIAANSEVLVAAYVGHQIRGLRWNPHTGATTAVGQPGVVPLKMTSTGVVLGSARDGQGNAVAVTAERGRDWKRLGTPDGYYASTINDLGDVAGYTEAIGKERPWVRFADGKLFWLPRYRHHLCRPFMISNEGRIVGEAAADHGRHALLWMPEAKADEREAVTK